MAALEVLSAPWGTVPLRGSLTGYAPLLLGLRCKYR